MTTTQAATFSPVAEAYRRCSRVDMRNPLADDAEIAQIMASLAADHFATAVAFIEARPTWKK